MKKLLFILTFIFLNVTMFAGIGEGDAFYANGSVKTKVVKHEKNYELIKFYENGSIQEIAFYDLNKEKTGTWTRYCENGCISATASFKHDKKDGDWKIYDENGKMVTYIKYKHGKKDIICTINENNELAVR